MTSLKASRERSARAAVGVLLAVVAVLAGVLIFLWDSVSLWGALILIGISVPIARTLLLGRAEMLWIMCAGSFLVLPFREFRLGIGDSLVGVPVRWQIGDLLVPLPAGLAVLVMVLLVIQGLLRQRLPVRGSVVFWSLGALLVGNVASLMVARYPEAGFGLLLKWLFHAVLFVFLASMTSRSAHLRTIVVLIVVTGMLSVYGLYTYAATDGYDVNFYEGIGTRTASALHLALVVPLAVSLASGRGVSLWMRMATGTAAVVSVLALALTYSRTGWVSVVLALVGMALMSRRLASFVAFCAGVVIFLTLAPETVQDRFFSIFMLREGAHSSITNALRIEQQSLALRVVSENPLFGVGLGNYVLEISGAVGAARYEGLGNVPHNFYLTVWAEGGVLAFVGLVGLLFSTMKMLLDDVGRVPRGCRNHRVLLGLFGSVCALTCFLFFADDFNHILVWTILGLSTSGSRIWAGNWVGMEVAGEAAQSMRRSVGATTHVAASNWRVS